MLAFIVCGLAAALLAVNVTQSETANYAAPSYANETEARLANLLQPILGSDSFQIAYNTSRPDHVSLILNDASFPDGALPIEKAALNELIANTIALPQDVVWVEIDYAAFATPVESGNTLHALNLALSFGIGLFSLALLWAVTRLTGASQAGTLAPNPLDRSSIRHDYADAPSPEKAAALIKSWMREVEPS